MTAVLSSSLAGGLTAAAGRSSANAAPARRAAVSIPASRSSGGASGSLSSRSVSFARGSASIRATPPRPRTTGAAAACRGSPLAVTASTVAPGATVLVVGATGGVGQLVTSKLLERGFKVKAMVRSLERAAAVLGSDVPGLDYVVGLDTRDRGAMLASGLMDGVDAVCCATGTTAFPSKRWEGGNNPLAIDFVGISNLVQLAEDAGLQGRFVLCSSVGVERYNQMPYKVLNLFGVLKWKKQGEQRLQTSTVPYTIVRPGRLTDGPYTSYDLNTLTKATSGTRRKVEMAAGDCLDGEASRIVVAEAMVQSLALGGAEGGVYCISSLEGDGPGEDAAKWESLFAACSST